MIIEALIFITLITLWWVWEDKKRHEGCPPGPFRIPVLGNLIQLSRLNPMPALAFDQLAKKYGDVFTLQIGSLSAVAFNSYEGIMEIFHHEKGGLTRAHNLIPVIKDRQMEGKNLGVIWSSDDVWVTLRRFTIRTLRDFGFGKAVSMDFVINEELEKLLKFMNTALAKTKDNVVRVDDLFDLSVINALWRLVTGVNYTLDNPRILRLMRLSNEMILSTSFAFDMSIAFPIVHPLYGQKTQRRIRDDLFEFARETIKEHRSRNYADDPQCFVDVFLSKIDESPESPEFNDDQLLMTILDLFQAGAETTSKSLGFSFLHMLLNENIQSKIHREIDTVVPEDVPIDMSYRPKLPYCYATVLEVQRHASVVPFPPMREASDDFQFENYTIKKGTALLLNTQAVHFSKKIWGDPDTFRPERFITEQGTVDLKLADYIISFGGGKRKCLGIQLAETSLFLYFATIMRNFQFKKVPGEKDPSIIPTVGMTNTPHPYNAKLIRRR